MAEMATKARAFQDFLDAKEIKAFVSETIENDPEETTVFRSHVEVDGQQLPLLVLLDVDIWANFKNACIMAVVEWRTTLQLLITAGLLDLMLLLFTYQALPFYIIILCAFNCLLGCSFVNQPFEKYFGSKKASEK